MPLDYNPEDASPTVPEGTYQASLEAVEDKVSKAGNDMQVWTWRVYGPREVVIKEYVTAATAFKIAQLAKALGKSEEFKAKKFQADNQIGCNVNVFLKVEAQEGYEDQNRIAKYSAWDRKPGAGGVPLPTGTRSLVGASKSNPDTVTEEDIPF